MHRRRAALHGEVDTVAALHRQLHLVQIGDLADRRGNDRGRRRTAGARLAEFGFNVAGLTGKGRVDHAVERQRRGIGHHRHHVGEFDGLLIFGVERELADFVARGEPVAAEQRH